MGSQHRVLYGFLRAEETPAEQASSFEEEAEVLTALLHSPGSATAG